MMSTGPFLYIRLARTGSVVFTVPKGKYCTTTAISVMVAVKLFCFAEEPIKLTIKSSSKTFQEKKILY